MNQRLRILLAATVALLLCGAPASAHAPEQSYGFLTIQDQLVRGRFEATIKDLNGVLGTRIPTDGNATDADVAPHIDAIRAYFLKHASFGSAEGNKPIRMTGYRLFGVSFSQFVCIEFTLGEFAEAPAYIDISYTAFFDVEPDHRALFVIENNWSTGTFDNEAMVALTFGPDSTSQTLDLSDASLWTGFRSMVRLGVHHIWNGLDHILFLLELLLPAVLVRKNGKWEPAPSLGTALWQVVKIVTVFTLAHSVTQSLAPLDVEHQPSHLVESIIAISIAVAATNLLVPIFRGRVWVVVASFGLFHGFGFAGVLSEMGIPPNFMVLSLLGFNVGVELGQVVIVCVLFPVLFALRGTRLYTGVVLKAGAVLLVAISLYWFTERAFDVDLPAGAIVNSVLGLKS